MKKLTRSHGKACSQLKETLKRQIEIGDLKLGERLMAERKLSTMFSISRESVRRGMQELAEEGYLKMVPGKGMVVDYRGSQPVRGHRSSTSTLGYVFWGSPETVLHTPFFEDIVRAVEEECDRQGYYLMVAAQKEVDAGEIPPIVLDRKVDGVLLEGGSIEAYRMIEQHVPVVMLSNFIRQDEFEEEHSGDMVAIDNQRAVMNLFNYLFSLGHRKIGFVSPPLDHSAFYERYEGYQFAMHKYGLLYRKEHVLFTRALPDVEAVRPIFEQADPPSAIMAVNDMTAILLLEFAERSGVPVPERISITGFDDIVGMESTRPPLTTVRISTRDMGRLAVRRLIQKLDSPDQDETWTLIPGKIVRRQSCAPARDYSPSAVSSGSPPLVESK